jgi:hypothetical protein
MTTSKRTPIKRDRHVLTPEAVEAFVAALKLRTHREQQIGDSTSCAGIDSCETCKAYERHVAVVSARDPRAWPPPKRTWHCEK